MTGGLGFLGRALVGQLVKRGHAVVVYDVRHCAATELQDGVTVHAGDVRDSASLEALMPGVDMVFHLSGKLGTSELFDDPTGAIDVNIRGALNVLEAARRHSVARVLLPGKINIWNNIYSVTAQAVEKLGHSYREFQGMDVRVLRIPNAYGPGQALVPVRKAVPLFVAQALLGQPLQIFGDGRQRVDPVYVDDVASAMIDYLLAEGPISDTHAISSEAPTTVRELAQQIVMLAGSQSPLSYLPMRRGESDPPAQDSTRNVAELTGPRTRTPLREGLVATIAWYAALAPQILDEARRFHGSAP